jgi:hypothetical protein
VPREGKRLDTPALRHGGVWGVDIKSNVSLTSALVGDEWPASGPGRFTSEKNPGTQWLGGRVGPRAVLHDTEKSNVLTLSCHNKLFNNFK